MNTIIAILIIGIVFLILAIPKIIQGKRNQNALASKPQDWKEDDFIDAVCIEIKKHRPNTPLNYNQKDDSLFPDGYTENEANYFSVFLGNLRNKCLDMTKQDREQFLSDFLSHAFNPKDLSKEEFVEHANLRARTSEEISLKKVILGQQDGSYLPLLLHKGELALELVADSDTAVQSITLDTLKSLDISENEAVDIAWGNLSKYTPNTEEIWEQIDQHIWAMKFSDDYDSARLVAFGSQLKLPIKDKIIAFMPSHSVCLITDREDEDILAKMIEYGTEATSTHRPLSFDLWESTDDGWIIYSPEDSKVAKQSRLNAQLIAYEEQHQHLTALFESKGQDIFVPKVMLVEKDDSSLVTLAVYIGADTLIPKVDKLVLYFKDDPGDNNYLDWSDFVSIIGEDQIVEFPELSPVRYDCLAPLSKKQKEQLTKASKGLE